MKRQQWNIRRPVPFKRGIIFLMRMFKQRAVLNETSFAKSGWKEILVTRFLCTLHEYTAEGQVQGKIVHGLTSSDNWIFV